MKIDTKYSIGDYVYVNHLVCCIIGIKINVSSNIYYECQPFEGDAFYMKEEGILRIQRAFVMLHLNERASKILEDIKEYETYEYDKAREYWEKPHDKTE